MNPTAAQKWHAQNPHQSCLTSTASVLSLTPKVPKPGTWSGTGAATRICSSSRTSPCATRNSSDQPAAVAAALLLPHFIKQWPGLFREHVPPGSLLIRAGAQAQEINQVRLNISVVQAAPSSPPTAGRSLLQAGSPYPVQEVIIVDRLPVSLPPEGFESNAWQPHTLSICFASSLTTRLHPTSDAHYGL